MRLEQGKLCLCIRKAEQSFKQLFSQKRAFSGCFLAVCRRTSVLTTC